MRVSLSWLREFVDIDLAEEEVAHRLNMSGTKVEAIHRPSGEVRDVVVAEILDVSEHPNADNLSLVEVTSGGEPQVVVCGARNFAVGDRVPLATVGAQLPGLAITERKIRGQVSRGMLCSASELGIGTDHAGILVLQPDSPLGEDVVTLLRLDDTILELEVTPNRPDCMSMIGVAREVAALTGADLRIPEPEVKGAPLDVEVTVQIEDGESCPRYLARYIEGIEVKSSPAWMAARLLAAGLRPISNIVDVTNYILLETGQPLHAFDADRVAGSTIIVRRAAEGETIETLDGVTRRLDPEDLLIAGTDRALALAGVMGGSDSEVHPDSRRVILESAYFAPARVSFTSRRHLLRTEASARFERGADPEMVPHAAARATELMVELAGGRAAEGSSDRYERPHERLSLRLRPTRTEQLIGLSIPATRQGEHLRNLGMNVTGTEVLTVEVPSFRPDLSREVDLVEEVARLEGFDKIPARVPTGPAGRLTPEQKAERTLRRLLAARGLTEAWTSSFMQAGELDMLGLDPDHPARRNVRFSNPMFDQEPGLRTTLLPGLLRSMARNVAAHRPDGAALFEVASVYRPSTGDLAEEEQALAAALTGRRRSKWWGGAAEPWDFFSAKSVITAVLSALGLEGARFAPTSGAPFHPTRAAQVSFQDLPVGVIGELHPDVAAGFGVPERTIGLELALTPIFDRLPGRGRASLVPRFPGVNLDLAVVVEDGIQAARVESLIRSAGGERLRRVYLFDVYRGEQVAAGHKSLAFSLEVGDPERTLTDEDAFEVRDRILQVLRERVGAEARA